MKYFYILIVIILFTKCNNSARETLFATSAVFDVETVEGKSIATSQILNPKELIIIDDYLVLSNGKKDSLFCVFSLDDFNVVRVFGKKGRGPTEYVFPNLRVGTAKESDFYIQDAGKRKIETIDIHKLVTKNEDYLTNSDTWSSSKIPLNAIINANNIIFDSFTPNDGAIYHRKSGEDAETIIHDFSDIKETYKNSAVYKGYLIAGNDKLVYAYQFFKRFDILDNKGNLLSSVSLSKNVPSIKSEGFIDRKKSMVYYIGAFAGKKYFYLLSFDGNGEYYEKNMDNLITSIEVYDWEG